MITAPAFAQAQILPAPYACRAPPPPQESILPKSPAAAHEEVTLAQQQPPQREVDPESETWDNSVAVCAIMKQERLSDIREWLLYHKCAPQHS